MKRPSIARPGEQTRGHAGVIRSGIRRQGTAAALALVVALLASSCASPSSAAATPAEAAEDAWHRYLRLSTELMSPEPSFEARAFDGYSHGRATEELLSQIGFARALGLPTPVAARSEGGAVTMVDDTTATIEPCMIVDLGPVEFGGEGKTTRERVRVLIEFVDDARWSVAQVEYGRGTC